VPIAAWKTFLRNHADGIVAMDMFVPTGVVSDGLLILQHARREPLWLGVTAHPGAQWVAQQLTEALGCKDPPRYLDATSFGVLGLWAFATNRSRRTRHGRTDT
jgi:hypothetical protein